jgi:RimJ/RimL family protein N-acetyltransferase
MADDAIICVIDKQGEEIRLVCCTPVEKQAVREMYDGYNPKAMTQGLPPADDRARAQWINGLLECGHNFVALRHGCVIGHCSLIPGGTSTEGEYLIFVLDRYRNRGLGTELTRLALKKARELGLETVWLTVEALNFRAIKLYKKMGFAFCDSGERERTMVLRL